MIVESRSARGTDAATETVDAIVVGGGLAGLVVAHLVSQNGYRTVLVEKSEHLGGFDRSFRNANGRPFDFGLHVLDHMRSEFTTRLFESIVDGRVHAVERDRGIVLGGHVIPYNTPLEEWPESLRRMFPDGDVIDTIGTQAPTRERIASVYGAAFADHVFDDALRSYPSDHRHLSFGIEEERLVSGLYPWFFPRVPRSKAELDESRRYQDRVRETRREWMLYPDAGGFGAFVDGFRQTLEARGVAIRTGVELELDWDEEAGRVRRVAAGDEAWSSQRIYWCAPGTVLAGLPAQETIDARPDRFVLGSFEFDREVSTPHNELIVADPDHLMNRVSFPGKLALDRDDRVQIEFAFPKDHELGERNDSFWMESWLSSLKQLGIVPLDAEVADFDLKRVLTFYNSFGIDGRPMPEVDLSFVPEDSNLRPVIPTIAKANINRRVPQYFEFLARDLASNPT